MSSAFDITNAELIQFKNDILDKIIQTGVTVQYYKAIACPCSLENFRQPQFICSKCDGLGYAYKEPVEVKVHIVNRRNNKNFIQVGPVSIGTAYVTFPEGFIPAEWDKIWVKEELVTINNDILKRGELATDGTSLERIRFRKFVAIEEIRDLNQAFYEGIDFNVVNDRYISWVEGRGPEAGKRYSLRYRVAPEYLILGYEPAIRMPGDEAFPYRAECRRLDRININDTGV